MDTKVDRVRDDPRRGNRNFPNAFAADLISHLGPLNRASPGTFLLQYRDDCMTLVRLFARVLEIPEPDLAERLAEYYLEHEEEIVSAAVERIRAVREARGGG